MFEVRVPLAEIGENVKPASDGVIVYDVPWGTLLNVKLPLAFVARLPKVPAETVTPLNGAPAFVIVPEIVYLSTVAAKL